MQGECDRQDGDVPFHPRSSYRLETHYKTCHSSIPLPFRTLLKKTTVCHRNILRPPLQDVQVLLLQAAIS
jgi:hypothetical protein